MGFSLQKHMKNAEDSDYPSYGIVGPNKDYEKKERNDAGDRKLAQSAQMYHYQHQKQQIIAMGRWVITLNGSNQELTNFF